MDDLPLDITHDLKLSEEFFEAVWNGSKTFEVRINDRDYKNGDKARLNEWPLKNSAPLLRTRFVETLITYVTDYEQKPGMVVFGFQLIYRGVHRR